MSNPATAQRAREFVHRDQDAVVGNFFTLSPDRVLDAVESAGGRTTGLCYALNSLENRVYEVELEDQSRQVVKFYRPDRWSRDCIVDEHRLLFALREAEIPVCAPLRLDDGESVHATPDHILFAVFPRTGGRAVEELDLDGYQQLGRLIARIHNVSAELELPHRPILSPATYGRDALAAIARHSDMSAGLKARLDDAAGRLIEEAERRFAGLPTLVAHADCHRGNLLAGGDGWFFLDFDDCAMAPAVQDLWLLLPARVRDCPQELEALLDGYQQFRDFDHASLGLIEVLRGLRYLRYAAWVATRWDDPAFRRAFAHFGNDAYWQNLMVDLHEQLAVLQGV